MAKIISRIEFQINLFFHFEINSSNLLTLRKWKIFTKGNILNVYGIISLLFQFILNINHLNMEVFSLNQWNWYFIWNNIFCVLFQIFSIFPFCSLECVLTCPRWTRVLTFIICIWIPRIHLFDVMILIVMRREL